MKIIVTGSLGNISKPLAQQLIKAGHTVTVISSDAGKAAVIEALGATAAIGSLGDSAFLTHTFTGADAIYAMVPPNFGAANLRDYMNQTGRSYAEAIKKSCVKKVVALSSIGAHLSEGVGPIKGLHDLEAILGQLEDVVVSIIRAPLFYVNLLNDIPLVKHQGIIGSNYPADARLILVHPTDIADAVAEELQKDFTDKAVRYIVSDESTAGEVAATLGAAIGQPNLPWVEFTDEQALNGMLQGGVPPEIANNFIEMGQAVRQGIIWEDYDQHKPTQSGKVKLQDFAKEFAERFAL